VYYLARTPLPTNRHLSTCVTVKSYFPLVKYLYRLLNTLHQIRAAIGSRSGDDGSLEAEVARHWDEIVQETYSFDQRAVEVGALILFA